MYGGNDDGNLMAIVRSYSRLIKGREIAGTPPYALDPLICLPPPPPPSFPMGMEESLSKNIPDLVPTNQTMLGRLEDIYSSFLHPPQPPHANPQPLQPHPQPQPQQQTGLFQTLLVAAGVVCPTTIMVSKPLGQQPPLKQMRKPQSLAMKSYYKCSACKSCPARKMVNKSPLGSKDVHHHLLWGAQPPAFDSLELCAGITHKRYSTSSSGDKKVDNEEGVLSGLSPITLLEPLPSIEVEDEEEVMLDIEDIKFINDELLGDAQLTIPVAAGSTLLFSEAEDPFLSQLWDNNNVFFDNNDGGAATGEGHGGAN